MNHNKTMKRTHTIDIEELDKPNRDERAIEIGQTIAGWLLKQPQLMQANTYVAPQMGTPEHRRQQIETIIIRWLLNQWELNELKQDEICRLAQNLSETIIPRK